MHLKAYKALSLECRRDSASLGNTVNQMVSSIHGHLPLPRSSLGKPFRFHPPPKLCETSTGPKQPLIIASYTIFAHPYTIVQHHRPLDKRMHFHYDSAVGARRDAESKARWAARRDKIEHVVRSKDPAATKLRKLVGKVCRLDYDAASKEFVYRPKPVVNYGEPHPPPEWFNKTTVTSDGLPVYTHNNVPPETLITASSSSGSAVLVPGTWWHAQHEQREHQPAPEYTSRNPSPCPPPPPAVNEPPVYIHEAQAPPSKAR